MHSLKKDASKYRCDIKFKEQRDKVKLKKLQHRDLKTSGTSLCFCFFTDSVQNICTKKKNLFSCPLNLNLLIISYFKILQYLYLSNIFKWVYRNKINS